MITGELYYEYIIKMKIGGKTYSKDCLELIKRREFQVLLNEKVKCVHHPSNKTF